MKYIEHQFNTSQSIIAPMNFTDSTVFNKISKHVLMIYYYYIRIKVKQLASLWDY